MDLDVGPLIKLPKGIAEDINDPIDVLKIDPLFMPKPGKEIEPVVEKKLLNLSTKENEKSTSTEEPKKAGEKKLSTSSSLSLKFFKCKFCYKTFTSKEDQMEHSARAHLMCSEVILVTFEDEAKCISSAPECSILESDCEYTRQSAMDRSNASSVRRHSRVSSNGMRTAAPTWTKDP